MKESLEKPYYRFNAIGYISLAIIGIAIPSLALAIIFTVSAYSKWVFILCWVLGIILLMAGVLWHLFMGFAGQLSYHLEADAKEDRSG